MAGIGFTLKKLFREEFYLTQARAYLYSALVAAGPWIAAVITVNLLIFLSESYFSDLGQRDLFMGTIVYSFVFSQIVTAPWQLLITRYLSDQLYSRSYDKIRPSFLGLSRLVLAISLLIGILYYAGKALPLSYKLMAVTLFLLLSLLWVIMVYLSAIKNYQIIAWAYVFGGGISIILALVFIKSPLPFAAFSPASNVLFAYTFGVGITYGILLFSFLRNFYQGEGQWFDFLRYIGPFKALMGIGLFYTLGLWIDDLIMWYSPLAVSINEVYQFAPLYDQAMFLAYLTVIPTMVLFMVSVETEFYDLYKRYYGLASRDGTLKELEYARQDMRRSIYRQILHTLEVQTLITVTLIVLSGRIFSYLGIPLLVKDIFRITSLGALCNIFILILILILLYFEGIRHALIIAAAFFVTNAALTVVFIPWGIDFYGFGYFTASFVTLLFAWLILIRFLRDIHYNTFARQPLFRRAVQGFPVRLAEWMNRWAGR